jgi:hypothetical protein
VFTTPGLLLDLIGRGPSKPDRLGGATMIVLAAVLAFAAVSPTTRLRGTEVPIGSAGRLILLIVAVTIFVVGFQGLLR